MRWILSAVVLGYVSAGLWAMFRWPHVRHYVALGLLVIPIALWVIALTIDNKFFGGRFLIKDNMDAQELKSLLGQVLNEGKKPLRHWGKDIYFWFWDAFYLVSFLDPKLESIRVAIVEAMDAHSNDDEPLHPEIVEKIEKHISAL